MFDHQKQYSGCRYGLFGLVVLLALLSFAGMLGSVFMYSRGYAAWKHFPLYDGPEGLLCSLNSFKAGHIGDHIGGFYRVIEGDARNLDYGLHAGRVIIRGGDQPQYRKIMSSEYR